MHALIFNFGPQKSFSSLYPQNNIISFLYSAILSHFNVRFPRSPPFYFRFSFLNQITVYRVTCNDQPRAETTTPSYYSALLTCFSCWLYPCGFCNSRHNSSSTTDKNVTLKLLYTRHEASTAAFLSAFISFRGERTNYERATSRRSVAILLYKVSRSQVRVYNVKNDE